MCDEPRVHAELVQVFVLGVVRLPREEVSGITDVRAALRLQRSTRPCGADCGPSDAPARARTRALSWTLVHALVRPGHYGAQSSPAPHVRPCVLRRDKNFNCHSWAKAGECKSNAAFMKKQCPESCKKHDDGSGEYLG